MLPSTPPWGSCYLGVPDSKHAFCASVYYPVLDNVIRKIERRFSNANSNIIHALNPSSPTFLREEAVLLLAEAYESNIEDLKYELHQTRRVLDRTRGKRKVLPLKWSLHSFWSHSGCAK